MADKDFIVKNGLVVNTYFSANSTNVVVSSTNTIINSNTSINGSNTVISSNTTINGTNTVINSNTLINASSIKVQGTFNDASANLLSQTLTDGATISWDTSLGRNATVTLGGNRAIANATNLKIGTYILVVKQDGSGSRTLTWGGVYKWPAGVAPTLTTNANATDIMTFYSDGTNMYGTYINNVS